MALKVGDTVAVQETKREGPIKIDVDRVGFGDWFFGRRKDTPGHEGFWYRVSTIVPDGKWEARLNG